MPTSNAQPLRSMRTVVTLHLDGVPEVVLTRHTGIPGDPFYVLKLDDWRSAQVNVVCSQQTLTGLLQALVKVNDAHSAPQAAAPCAQ